MSIEFLFCCCVSSIPTYVLIRHSHELLLSSETLCEDLKHLPNDWSSCLAPTQLLSRSHHRIRTWKSALSRWTHDDTRPPVDQHRQRTTGLSSREETSCQINILWVSCWQRQSFKNMSDHFYSSKFLYPIKVIMLKLWASVTAALLGGCSLSTGKKCSNLYRSRRWPTVNLIIVDHLVRGRAKMFMNYDLPCTGKWSDIGQTDIFLLFNPKLELFTRSVWTPCIQPDC